MPDFIQWSVISCRVSTFMGIHNSVIFNMCLWCEATEEWS